ncbi:MAG: DUF4199 domain-containing protein [Bacteroidetes bacterium]|nr:DUF4199 domain-containing protein [Bacteroidota bacterium]
MPTAIKFGIYNGLCLVIIYVVSYIMDMMNDKALDYISWLVSGIIIAWGIKTYRDEFNRDGVTYGKAFGLGSLIGVYGSIMLSVFIYILYVLIDTNLVNILVDQKIQEMIDSGKSEEIIQKRRPLLLIFTKPHFLALGIFIGYSFIGFLGSLVASIFFKSNTNSLSA